MKGATGANISRTCCNTAAAPITCCTLHCAQVSVCVGGEADQNTDSIRQQRDMCLQPGVVDVSMIMPIVQVRYVLKNLMRDWSAEGAAERAQSYGWIIDALRRHCPPAPAAPLADATATAPAGAAAAVAASGRGSADQDSRAQDVCADITNSAHVQQSTNGTNNGESSEQRAAEPVEGDGAAQAHASARQSAGAQQHQQMSMQHSAAPQQRCPRVLVPGCGLGRLVVELAACGYEAVGNEFSLYMLLTLRCARSHHL